MKNITKLANGNIRVSTVNNEPNLTQQQFKEQCDVNNIIKRYKLTGDWPITNKKGGYSDLSNLPSYQEALNTVLRAQEAFTNLSSDIRKRFDNDPQKMLQFLEDKNNDPEAVRLGLKEPKIQDTQTQILNELKKSKNTNETNTKTTKNPNTPTE